MSNASASATGLQMVQQLLERLLPVSPAAVSAKRRLQLLRLQDRGIFTPRDCADLKRRIQEVCAGHSGINADAMDLRLENHNGEIAVVASIPVKKPLP